MNKKTVDYQHCALWGFVFLFLFCLHFRFYNRLFISSPTCFLSRPQVVQSDVYTPPEQCRFTPPEDLLLSWLNILKGLLMSLTSSFLPSFLKWKQGKLFGGIRFLHPYSSVQCNAYRYERPAVLVRFPVSWGHISVLLCMCYAGGQNRNQLMSFLRDPSLFFCRLLVFS